MVHFFDYDTRVAGYAVLIDEAGRILLTWYNGSGTGEACWSLPGGGVEFGEQIDQAVTREVHEETGYLIEVGRPLAGNTFTRPDWGRDGRPFASVRVLYEGVVTGGTLGTLEVGGTTDSAAWLYPAQIFQQDAVADVVLVALDAIATYGDVMPRSPIGPTAPAELPADTAPADRADARETRP